MASFNGTTPSHPGWTWELPKTMVIRLGRRELSIGRDVRPRYYETNPVIGCRPGLEKGHLEVLLFRRWLLVLSKAR
ncbi:MAG TPA: hypothetical protein VEC06_10240 [Paucimonas sp.]|nr:hypothetical protein [Paucimonas sp.]